MKTSGKLINMLAMSTLLTLSIACSKKNLNKDELASDENSVIEEVSKSIGSNLDANEPSSSSSNSMNKIETQGIYNSLDASTHCSDLALLAACSVDPTDGLGVKTAQYNACQVETPRSALALTLSGSVQLKYSNNNCGLNTIGDSVTRTYDLQYLASNNASVTVKSAATEVTDPVTGQSLTIGGGARLTHENAGWSLDILGRNVSVKNRRGTAIIDIAIKTAAPIVGHGYRFDGSRVVDSGTIEVFHKLAKYKTTNTVHNLQYSAQCCHPVAGTIDLNYQGADKAWTGTLTFTGCGTADLAKNGEASIQSISFNTCE